MWQKNIFCKIRNIYKRACEHESTGWLKPILRTKQKVLSSKFVKRANALKENHVLYIEIGRPAKLSRST